jgi:hypothetical protein
MASLRSLFPLLSFDGGILYLAQFKGYRVLEVSVTWRTDRTDEIRLWRDVFTSFLALLEVRLNYYIGKYR